MDDQLQWQSVVAAIDAVNATICETRQAALARDISPIGTRCARCLQAYGTDFTGVWAELTCLLAKEATFGVLSTKADATALDTRWLQLSVDVMERLDRSLPGGDFSDELAMMLRFVDHQAAIRAGLLAYAQQVRALQDQAVHGRDPAAARQQLTDRLWQIGEIAARPHSFLNAPLLPGQKPRY